jgi:hypothetical protein
VLEAVLRFSAMDELSVFERFLALAKRELQADDVRLLDGGEAIPDTSNVLVTRLEGGRHVVASFASPPKDRDALERRLAMLAGTFADALDNPPSDRSRARTPVATSLHEELKALAARARAQDAFVVDADSPVVWGYASVPARPRAREDHLLRDVSRRELSSHEPDESGSLQDVIAPDESSPYAASSDSEPYPEPELTRRTIAAVRALPALATLHKGRHLRHVERESDFYLVVSFSGIYVLCLVFDGPFDELRAERAAHDALPRVERLVEALPPLDPDPQPRGAVVAFRRQRRR